MTRIPRYLIRKWNVKDYGVRDHIYTFLVLILGIFVTYVLYLTSSRFDFETSQNKFAVNAEIVATSFDLLISNQTIRIQNYENDFQSFLTNVDENSLYTSAILRNSLFTKMIRVNAIPNISNRTRLNGLVKYTFEPITATDQDVRPAHNPYVKDVFHKIINDQRKYITFFFWDRDVSYFALAWSLPFKKNSYLLFLGEAEGLFASGQVMADGMSLILEQELDNTYWLIEKKQKQPIQVRKITPQESNEIRSAVDVLHHYRPRFSEASYNLTFFSENTVGLMEGRSRVILMSGVIITFLLALLINSLVRRNIEVQNLVGEKTAHLQIESEKAKEATYAKGRFLANVSHEIRTPLNIIMGMTDLMRETNLTKKQKEFIHNMTNAGNHLIRMIEDILDMARVDSQDVKFKFENVDFLKLMEEIVHLVRPVSSEKGLRFYFKMDPQFPSQIYTDPSRLKQVLINLLNNSIKFTDEGSVELEVNYLKKGPITTQTARVEFIIRDSGVGIPKSKQDDIFKAFYQVNPSTTRNKSGVGLGLAISQAIVTRLNGTITLNSEVGRGTEFHVELPLMVENLTPWIQNFTSDELKGKRLLVIHDRQEAYLSALAELAKEAELLTIHHNWQYLSSLGISDILEEADFILMIPDEFHQLTYVNSVITAADDNQRVLLMRSLKSLPIKLLKSKVQVSLISAPLLPTEFFNALGTEMPTESKSPVVKEFHSVANKSLVIVDDDPSNLMLLKAYLAGQSLKVRYASHGQNALEMCQQEKPDVLVADLQMPEMDGFTLVRELRKQNVEPMKVVILTADAQEETIQEATNLGIEAYLTKPIRKAEFLKALVEVLN